ncbi:MAG: hypothetical protein ACTHW1_06920 [Ancrocorticia sp.]|uniref:hypothetical protein n=1 Tax=Ancrocorticia sp. TaxID=2593684 RepID=UPI003F90569E
MLKNIIRIVSVLVSFSLGVLALGLVEELDSSFPLKTQYGVTVETGDSPLDKASLIDGLDTFADERGLFLAKVSSDREGSSTSKNLIFSGK